MKKALIFFCLLISNYLYSQSDTLKAIQAKDFVGKEVIVKDIIAGARLFERPDKKTFLINLTEAYPNTPLTIVLYDDVYTALEPKNNIDGKGIIVKGTVSVFNDKIQIVLTDLKNIKIL